MGTSMLVANGVCCCFSCLCRDISNAIQRMLGEERTTKIVYILLVMLFVAPAIVVFFFLYRWESFLTYFSSILACPASSGGTFECIGSSVIYRLSLSLLCLFFLMMLIMLCRNKFAMVVNEGLFFVKYLLVIGVFIGFLFISNKVFNNYAQASKYLSILFILLQVIILIDLFYLAGIKLVKRYDQGETYCGGVLIFFSIVVEALAILMNILGYIYFSKEICGNTLWVNIVTTLILVALPLLQLLNWNHQNSLLTTALVSMYISYLAFICQHSYGSSLCSRMSTGSLVSDIIISCFFFFLTMYGSIMGGSGQIKVTQNGDVNKAIGVAPEQAPPTNKENTTQENELKSAQMIEHEQQLSNEAKYESTWSWVKWHFYMCLASIYVGMLITNWTSSSIITGTLQSNAFGFWGRLSSSWVTALLYVWTLVAPKVFPDRDFTLE